MEQNKNHHNPQQAQNSVPQTNVIVITGARRCPNCQVGLIQENYSICGILWAIFCFPIGLICLFTMKEEKCGMCGALYNN